MKKYGPRAPRDIAAEKVPFPTAAPAKTKATTPLVAPHPLPDYNGPLFQDMAD